MSDDDNNPPFEPGQEPISPEELDPYAHLTREQTLAAGNQLMKKYLRLYALADVGGRTFVIYRFKQADGSMATSFMKYSNFRELMSNQFVPVIDKKSGEIKYKEAPEVWRRHPRRRNYLGVRFEPIPGIMAGETTLPDGDTYNLYQGMSTQPIEGNCDIILDHIFHIWCQDNQETYWYLIQWLAMMVQRPDIQGKTVIILKSGQGSGKNIIADIFVRLFASHSTICTKPDDLSGRFNDHLATSVFVLANEAHWVADKAAEGALKTIITDQYINAEIKFGAKYKAVNRTHILVISNEDWIAPMDRDDRRYMTYELTDERKQDSTYFSRLGNHIKNGGESAFVDYLMNKVDISAFNPADMPDVASDIKLDNKIRSAPTVHKWWLECLILGQIIVTDEQSREKIILSNGWHSGTIDVSTRDMYDSYLQWCTRSGIKNYKDNMASFGIQVRKLAPRTRFSDGISKARQMNSGVRTCKYAIPPLDQCRTAFENLYNHDIDWEEI